MAEATDFMGQNRVLLSADFTNGCEADSRRNRIPLITLTILVNGPFLASLAAFDLQIRSASRPPCHRRTGTITPFGGTHECSNHHPLRLTTRTTALGRLRTAALAAALACAANGAYASLRVGRHRRSSRQRHCGPGSFLFAPTDTRNQVLGSPGADQQRAQPAEHR